MSQFKELQADLHSLHDAIDQESQLNETRIATLRAITRHRFFSEELLKATGDWEPRQQDEERGRRHKEACEKYGDDLQRIIDEGGGANACADFINAKVPFLPREVSSRAHQPLGQLLKYIVHHIANTCLRDREEEAVEHWKREAGSYGREMEEAENARTFPDDMSPERKKKIVDALRKFAEESEKRQESREPGDDWVTIGEVVGDDNAFEANRSRILRGCAQELDLYMLILERRLKIRDSYSGLELINERELIPMLTERPDWEPDAKRDELIKKLEVLTGTSFREKESK